MWYAEKVYVSSGFFILIESWFAHVMGNHLKSVGANLLLA